MTVRRQLDFQAKAITANDRIDAGELAIDANRLGLPHRAETCIGLEYEYGTGRDLRRHRTYRLPPGDSGNERLVRVPERLRGRLSAGIAYSNESRLVDGLVSSRFPASILFLKRVRFSYTPLYFYL